MWKYLFLFTFILISCIDTNVKKNFIVINKFQGIKIELANLSYLNYEMNVEQLDNNFTFLSFQTYNTDSLKSCVLELFKGIKNYKDLEEFNGGFFDPKIPDDTLFHYLNVRDRKVVNIKSFKLRNMSYRIINTNFNNSFLETIATIYLDNGNLIYFRSSGRLNKLTYFFENIEKMLKSITVSDINKSTRN